MSRMLLWAGAAALAVGTAVVPVTADEHSDAKLGLLAEVPAPKELKIKDGTAEGHKTPAEVLGKAIKAAKADEMETLKACLGKDAARNADYDYYGGFGEEKGSTYLKAFGKLLAAYDDKAENFKTMEQGTVGNYAVVAVRKGEAVHMVRCVREAPEDADKEGGKKVYNWFLASCTPSDYRVDYNTSAMKTFRETLDSGDVAKLKEFIQEQDTPTLNLLKDVQEGVDPYGLLMKRLQKIGKNAEKPVLLLSRWGSGYENQVAFWFHSDTADTFIVLRFRDDSSDWENKKYQTKLYLDLYNIAEFHKDAGDHFKNFINDWDWG